MSESEQAAKNRRLLVCGLSLLFVVRGPYDFFFSPFTRLQGGRSGVQTRWSCPAWVGSASSSCSQSWSCVKLSAAVLASETLASSSACAQSVL